MTRFLRYLIFICFCALVVIYSFSQSDIGLSEVEYEKTKSVSDEPYISNIGADKKNGNILGIQPYMTPFDYSNEQRFYKKLEEYLIIAKENGYLTSQTIVVFPEHIGTPLFLMDEKREVYFSNDFEKIKNALIYPRYFKYIYHIITSSFKGNKDTEVLFKMKASKMRDSYVRVFSELSRFYNIRIFAGSILLPGGEIKNGTIDISNSELKNVTPIFSKGSILDIQLQKRAISVLEENYITSKGEPIEPFVLPDIRNSMAVLVSKDSLYNQNYNPKITVTDILLSPAFFPDREKILWQDPAISDTLKGDKSLFSESDKNLSKEEAWNKFGIAGKFPFLYARIYMQVFMRGEFFGIKFLGNSTMGYRYLKYDTVPIEAKSALLNIFF